MRIVESKKDLKDSIIGAQREAKAGFGDDRIFIERYVATSRHIEIQILGDSHGNIVHLGERECSIQRRHQKIIEESPSPRVDSKMRAAMGDAAIKLAKKAAEMPRLPFILTKESINNHTNAIAQATSYNDQDIFGLAYANRKGKFFK